MRGIVSKLSKSGGKIVFREPRMSDVDGLLGYVNELVDEDTMILINQKQTREQEKKYVGDALERLKKKELVQLLAFDGEMLVGNAQVEKDKWKASHTGIFGISVHRDYRGEGIGKALSEAVIGEAKKSLGIELVKLDVFAENETAIGLYKGLGFRECGKLPGGVKQKGELMDRIYMYRKI